MQVVEYLDAVLGSGLAQLWIVNSQVDRRAVDAPTGGRFWGQRNGGSSGARQGAKASGGGQGGAAKGHVRSNSTYSGCSDDTGGVDGRGPVESDKFNLSEAMFCIRGMDGATGVGWRVGGEKSGDGQVGLEGSGRRSGRFRAKGHHGGRKTNVHGQGMTSVC